MQSKIVAVNLWFASFLLAPDLNLVILSKINLFHSWPTSITNSDVIFLRSVVVNRLYFYYLLWTVVAEGFLEDHRCNLC